MAVHFHPPPQRAPAAAPEAPELPDHDIVVDGTTITARDIAAEMQHHPAEEVRAAWNSAARALVVRRLLLDAAGCTDPDPEEEDAAITALLAREVHVPEPDDAAARRWLAAHPERFGAAEAWDASHILVAADPEDAAERAAAGTRAAELLAQVLADPACLPLLAHRHSDCPSRDEGGSLGRVERGSTVPEFEAALAATAPGAVHPALVSSRYGLHIVQLHRHHPPRAPDFAEARTAVLRDLVAAAWHAAVRQYIAILAARATIQGITLDAEGEARADGPLVN